MARCASRYLAGPGTGEDLLRGPQAKGMIKLSKGEQPGTDVTLELPAWSGLGFGLERTAAVPSPSPSLPREGLSAF